MLPGSSSCMPCHHDCIHIAKAFTCMGSIRDSGIYMYMYSQSEGPHCYYLFLAKKCDQEQQQGLNNRAKIF